MKSSHKCVITGASGLLGKEVVPVLGNAFTAEAWGHTSARPDIIPVDLRSRDAVQAALNRGAPAAVVHMAAYREPDFCEANPDECRALNVESTRYLCELLPADAYLLFISTDYVFDGNNPPYSEGDERCAVNVYGQSKVESEDLVLARPCSAVLRVPLLIGAGGSLDDSGFVAQMRQAVLEGKRLELDDVLARFPTWTRDVAKAILHLIQTRGEGVWHYSGLEGKTRFEWTLEMARILGADSSHLVPSNAVIPRKARRPGDSQLVPARLRETGYNEFSTFETAVRSILSEFGALG